ncbi:DeoR/GlpR family DNA-binding transcription regulator [Teichococcus vastitatis]|uniref:DeoR/GlpR family DNA-binding transcription regulator n=1 Tax=Teichococcus vastitatis TaxID=2307076 RepID=A0ABS9W4R7_9PROT|nr:DeoR/GlpR family DNA-binding transcription regulator [Pseudoroseomonas vastitatis]MCI0753855.1 DeoR/GlpR family DNA-binding transcription regulator [Pseudoroseomonas vastitatis]
MIRPLCHHAAMPRRNTSAPRKPARHAAILEALSTDPTVRISELADAFGVSAETVRRDVEELSARGMVRRTYGGASTAARQPVLDERERVQVAERSRIGRAAALLVPPDAVVMLDAGSTTTHFARALARREIRATLLTNSLDAAVAAGACASLRVIVAPGELSVTERGVYGPETAAFLRRFHVDLAVIGASGLTEDGPCEAESRAAWVKRAMLERAARRLLLVDTRKFGAAFLECVCPLQGLTDLVAEAPPAGPLAAALARARVAVTLAPDDERVEPRLHV